MKYVNLLKNIYLILSFYFKENNKQFYIYIYSKTFFNYLKLDSRVKYLKNKSGIGNHKSAQNLFFNENSYVTNE